MSMWWTVYFYDRKTGEFAGSITTDSLINLANAARNGTDTNGEPWPWSPEQDHIIILPGNVEPPDTYAEFVEMLSLS